MHLSKSFDRGGVMVWGFSGAGLGPLVPVEGIFKASAYQDILDNFMLQTFCEQFADGPFPTLHAENIFRYWAWPLSSSKGILKASAYQDILDNFLLPTLW